MALGLLTGDLIVGDEFPVLRRPDHTGLKHRLELLRSPTSATACFSVVSTLSLPSSRLPTAAPRLR